MFRSFLVAGILLMAPQENLSYRAEGGDPAPIQQELTYALTLSGPQGLTTQLVSSNAALSVEQLRVTRKGRRVITTAGDGGRVEVQIAGAHVEARTRDNKALKFDFDQPTAPPDLAQDPIRQFAWGFSMAGQKYLLGAKGEYRLDNNDQDGQAEPMAIMLNVPVRLPDHPVNVGDQWNSEWTGSPRKKDGATMRFRQTARLDEIVGPSRRARISFATSGALSVPPEKNIQGEEMNLDAKGSILLDGQSGVVIASSSAGTMTTDIKKAGLQMVHTITSKTDAP
jgi:hypothetical protein